MFRPSVILTTLLLGGLLALPASLRASAGGFTATLSAEQQTVAGLADLSPVESIILDQLVAGELGALRRGEATELAGSFVSRRTAAELAATGLDRLTGAQLTKLNEYVASVLGARPKPKARPRLKESDVLAAGRQPQVHGSVTVGYGWGGRGRDLWAESLWLDYYDPASRVGIGIGLSNFNGRGYYGYYPENYGYYGGGRYYATEPAYLDASYRAGGPRGDFNYGGGQSFCGGGGRRH